MKPQAGIDFYASPADLARDDEEPEDEYEEALMNCSQFLDGGVLVCGALGSEQCDECPFNCDLGKTPQQAEDVAIEATSPSRRQS